MIKRHHPERALAMGVTVLGHMGNGGGTFRAVPPRHALGPSGRSGGVKHQRESLGIRAWFSKRRIARQESGERNLARLLRRFERNAREFPASRACCNRRR